MREDIADKIKFLRERRGMTQTELAKQLGLTRSGVNAWEMGLSVPSTQYVVDLAMFFNVSSDYLLGIASSSTLNVEGLCDGDICLLRCLIERLKSKNPPAQ